MSSTEYSRLAGDDPDSTPTVNTSIAPDRVVWQKQGRPSHTVVNLMHFLFKLLAVFGYMFGWLMTSSFIATFIIITLLLCADFWVVKNISGRLMAGLRWWSVVDEEGKLTWRYECWTPEQRELSNSNDATMFWVGLSAAQIIWSIFATIALFSLRVKWLLLCGVALCLNGANMFGCFRCRLGQVSVRQKLTEFLAVNILRRNQPDRGSNSL